MRGGEDAAGHLVRDRDEVLRLDAGALDETLLVGLQFGDGRAGRILHAGGAAAPQGRAEEDHPQGRGFENVFHKGGIVSGGKVSVQSPLSVNRDKRRGS